MEKRIKGLKEAGVDTLIFRVFQNKGDRIHKFVTPRHEEGVYFKTEHAPVVDDLLGKVAEIAHRNGLDIFAWMTTRYAAMVWRAVLNSIVRVIISKQKSWKWPEDSTSSVPMF